MPWTPRECVLKIALAALGAPGKHIKEGEEEVAGTTFDEPDAEMRGPPPQPEGTGPSENGRPHMPPACAMGSTASHADVFQRR